jgi:hypothetical protein
MQQNEGKEEKRNEEPGTTQGKMRHEGKRDTFAQPKECSYRLGCRLLHIRKIIDKRQKGEVEKGMEQCTGRSCTDKDAMAFSVA